MFLLLDLSEGGLKNYISSYIFFFFSHSVVPDFVTQLPVARQSPLSMGFSRQEYWRGLPLPFPGHLPTPGTNLSLLFGRQILYY